MNQEELEQARDKAMEGELYKAVRALNDALQAAGNTERVLMVASHKPFVRMATEPELSAIKRMEESGEPRFFPVKNVRPWN